MNHWDRIIFLIVAGVMFIDWLFAAHAFNEGNICAGIVMPGLGYIVALLCEIRD